MDDEKGTTGRTIRRPPFHTTVSTGGRHVDPQPGSAWEVPTTSPTSFISTPFAAFATRSMTYVLGDADVAMAGESDAELAPVGGAFARPTARMAPITPARPRPNPLMPSPLDPCVS